MYSLFPGQLFQWQIYGSVRVARILARWFQPQDQRWHHSPRGCARRQRRWSNFKVNNTPRVYSERPGRTEGDSGEKSTVFTYIVSAETIIFWIWKLYEIWIVAANFIFLPNKLNFWCRNYSRAETIRGNTVLFHNQEMKLIYFSPK